ncbi:MAG: DUF11 domain-containing protein [Chloroflexi bacterium]|nr:DUF11 domain-containing protein [Chloroflexota bacterium]
MSHWERRKLSVLVLAAIFSLAVLGALVTAGRPGETVGAAGAPDLSNSFKQVSSTTASPGQVLTYTIVLSNTGDVNATTLITDALASSLTYSSGSGSSGVVYNTSSRSIGWTGTVTAGAAVSVTYSATITNPLGNGTLITNTATINDGQNIPLSTRPVTTTVSSAPILTTSQKTVNRAISSPGGTIGYSIVVSNTGNVNTSARVTDDLPVGVAYVDGSLRSPMGTAAYDGGTRSIYWTGTALVGVPVTIRYQATVPASTASGSILINTATIQASGGGAWVTPPVTVTVASNPSRVGWTNLGLYGARLESAVVDSATGVVLAATGGTVGVYRSVDGGNSWRPSTSFAGCLRLLLDRASGAAYASCRPSPNAQGVWKSTDAGASWTPIVNSSLVPGFRDGETRALALAGTTLYVAGGSDGNLYRSTDGGASWSQRGSPDASQVRGVGVDATNPAVVYATTSSKAFKSTDGGATWADISPVGGSDFRAAAVNPHNPSIVMLGSMANGGGRLYKSSDAGASWTTVLSESYNSWIQFHPTDPNTVYIQGRRSTDGGLTWSGFGIRGGGLAVDATNPNIIYGGSTQGVHKSTDNGATWQEVNTGLEEMMVLDVRQNSQDPNNFFIASPSGFGSTIDGALNWTWPVPVSSNFDGIERSEEIAGSAVAVEPSAAYLAGGAGNNLAMGRSTDHGTTWAPGNLRQVIQSNLGASTRAGVAEIGVVPGEVGRLFAAVRESSEGNATPKGGVYESVDGGLTWTATGLTGVPVNTIDFGRTGSGTIVYAGVGDWWGRYAGAGGVYTATTSNAATWHQTGIPAAAITKLRVDPTDPLRVYAGGGFVRGNDPAGALAGVVYRTDDGGATVQIITPPQLPSSGPTGIQAMAIDPVFPGNIFVSVGNTVYQSANGGSTWSIFSQADLGMAWIGALLVPLAAPSPVITFTATISGDEATLSWTNPSDADFAGVALRYSTEGYPQLSTHGTALATYAGAPGAIGSHVQSGVVAGTTYYYSAFAYNTAGRYSLPAQAAANSNAPGPVNAAGALAMGSMAVPTGMVAVQTNTSSRNIFAAAGGGLFAASISADEAPYRLFLPVIMAEFQASW